MSRFTEYHCGVAVLKDKQLLKNAVHKLANYEDLEDAGLLIDLPCKIGTQVYVIVEVYKRNGEFEHYQIIPMEFDIRMRNSFGEKVFLTEREAEAKLKEMEQTNG